jgi:predicted O-methyltransferase YrrM
MTRRLPVRDPARVFPEDDLRVLVSPFAGRFGNVKQHEMILICAAARYLHARRIVEFGTFDGLTTWHLAVNCPDAEVLTIDLPLDHSARSSPVHDRGVGKIHGVAVGSHFQGTQEAGRIEQVLCDSMDFDPAPLAGSVDLTFIDASHEYHHVMNDTDKALIMTRPGGLIVWHDYSKWWPGVQRCLDALSKDRDVFQVAGTALAMLSL